MAIEGLTQAQSDFIERFVHVPAASDSKSREEQRKEAMGELRLFDAEQAVVREEILRIEDASVKAALLSRLAGAQTVLEQDQDRLNFAAAEAHLTEVQQIAARAAVQEQAETQMPQMSARISALNPAPADLDHVWTYAQQCFEAGVATRSAHDLQEAVTALTQLDGMVALAEKEAQNPFRADAAQAEAQDSVVMARRSLMMLFDQLAALNDTLHAQFGEDGVPLSLRIALSGVQNKLNAAVEAAPAQLPALADEVEGDFAQAEKDARALIKEAQGWQQENERFLVRYRVMRAHPLAADADFVKPEFDKIVEGYTAAKEKAAAHDYLAATQEITVLGHNLKDALDFADDCAAFEALLAQRKALVGTLPADSAFAIDRLKDDAAAARAMIGDAVNLRNDGQVVGAVALLNQVPGAVADVLAEKQFANDFNARFKRAEEIQARLRSQAETEVQALIAADLEDAKGAADAAEADAARGAYRSAAGQMTDVLRHLAEVERTAAYLGIYIEERAGLAQRLAEVKGAEGREAIEGYYAALQQDEAKRASAEAAGDFRTANACCLRLKDDHDARMREASDAETYLDRKLDLEVAMAGLDDDPASEEVRQAALDKMAQAVDASLRGNWLAAANLLDNAVLEVERAEADAENMALINNIQNDEAINLSAGGDFDAAFAVFEKVLNRVNGLDDEALFMDQLIDAELKARSAEADMDDDVDAAQGTLDEAIDDCKSVAKALTAAAGFADRVAVTDRLIAQAEDASDSEALDEAARQARLTVMEAEEAAEEPDPDFPRAFDLLAQAEDDLAEALEARAVDPSEVAEAENVLQRCLTLYQRADVAAYLKDEAEQTQAKLDALKADVDAGRMWEARSKASEARGLEAAAIEIMRDCAEVVGWLAALDGFAPHPVARSEAEQVAQLRREADNAMNGGQWATSLMAAKQAHSLMARAQGAAEAFDAYLPVKLAAQEQMDALAPRAVFDAGPAYQEVDALQARLDEAMDEEGRGQFVAAARRLEGFEAACAATAVRLDAYDRALLAKTRGEDALQEVNAQRTPEIEPIYARLDAKREQAERQMSGYDFDAATTLYTELRDDCDAALDTLGAVSGFTDVVNDIGQIPDDDTTGLLAAIAGVRQKRDKLRADPSAIYAPDELAEVDRLLDDAQAAAPRDFSAARIDLEAAVERCAQIAVLMAQFNYMERMYAKVRGIAADLIGRHDLRKQEEQKDYALQDIIGRMAMLDTAVGAARSSADQRAQTQLDIEETIATLRDLRPVMDKHLAYVRERTPVDKELYELERGPQRQLIREHLRLARRHLEVAGTRADERSHRAAREEITAASMQLDMAKLRIKVATNDKPSPKDIKPLLNSPEGMESLDVTVNALDPNVQREVMAAAFEARFGCALEPENDADAKDRIDLPQGNIVNFYKEMAKLPPSDDLGDGKMLNFLELSGIGQGAGKASAAREDAVALPDPAEALAAEVGEVDPDAVPRPGEDVSPLGWNALLAAGQAVNAKSGFMRSNGERLAGWTDYGDDVAAPAAEIAQHFDFDPGYVAAYMAASPGKMLDMPEPVGCTPEEWRGRMNACRAFVDAARVGNRPWTSASVAAACAIGGFTYVEGRAGHWARYRTDARKSAVSGTQFRSPDDWFAELYAALHTGRLNENHPHRADIEQL